MVDCADGSDEFECQANGKVVDQPAIVNLRFDSDELTLRWDAPDAANQASLLYNVYFGQNWSSIAGRTSIHIPRDQQDRIFSIFFFIEKATDDPEVILPLEPCRRYIAGVSLLDDDWKSTRPRNWFRFRTPYDPRAEPLNAKYQMVGRRVRISWQHNCRLAKQQPPHYVLRVTDLFTNRPFGANNDNTEVIEVHGLNYEYRMAKGTQYIFEVATSHPDAIPTVWTITAPPLPMPKNFKFVAGMKRNTFIFNWEPVTNFHDETYDFE